MCELEVSVSRQASQLASIGSELSLESGVSSETSKHLRLHSSTVLYISKKSTGSNRCSLIDFWKGNDRAYLLWDREMESLALRFHYLLSLDKMCMTYLSFNLTLQYC